MALLFSDLEDFKATNDTPRSPGRRQTADQGRRTTPQGHPGQRQNYFIHLADRSGLLPALTDLMINRACAQLANWSTRLGRTDLEIGVKVPPALMTDADFRRRAPPPCTDTSWPRNGWSSREPGLARSTQETRGALG